MSKIFVNTVVVACKLENYDKVRLSHEQALIKDLMNGRMLFSRSSGLKFDHGFKALSFAVHAVGSSSRSPACERSEPRLRVKSLLSTTCALIMMRDYDSLSGPGRKQHFLLLKMQSVTVRDKLKILDEGMIAITSECSRMYTQPHLPTVPCAPQLIQEV